MSTAETLAIVKCIVNFRTDLYYNQMRIRPSNSAEAAPKIVKMLKFLSFLL